VRRFKIASLIASFKFERGEDIMKSEMDILYEAQKVLNNIINKNK
jgi:exonuclease VII small subunit